MLVAGEDTSPASTPPRGPAIPPIDIIDDAKPDHRHAQQQEDEEQEEQQQQEREQQPQDQKEEEPVPQEEERDAVVSVLGMQELAAWLRQAGPQLDSLRPVRTPDRALN